METLVTKRNNRDKTLASHHRVKQISVKLVNGNVQGAGALNGVKEQVKESRNKDCTSCPDKRKSNSRFPHDVFTSTGGGTIAGPGTKKTQTMEKTTSAAKIPHMTPATIFKRTPVPRQEPLLAQARDESHCVKEKIGRSGVSHLPAIPNNKKPTELQCCTSATTATPRWKMSGKNLMENTMRFSSIGELQGEKHQTRHNSNQIANLELASHCAVKPKPARVIIKLDQEIKNLKTIMNDLDVPNTSHSNIMVPKIVRLKPIQRDAISSQGTTVKILHPDIKEYSTSKTRPSSKEDEFLRKFRQQARPEADTNPPLSGTVKLHPSTGPAKSKRRVVLNSNLIDWLPAAPQEGDLCNVTFGDSHFASVQK